MVEPVGLSVVGTAASELLKHVMHATEIAINCNKFCKALHALLKELQPIVDHAVDQISQSNPGHFCTSRSAVHGWLVSLEGTLRSAETEVNKCIQQYPDLNPFSRYKTAKSILDVTGSVKKLLDHAALVVLNVAVSHFLQAEKLERMVQELQDAVLRLELANITRESFAGNRTENNAEGVTYAIRCVLQRNLSIRPNDYMTGVAEARKTMLDVQPGGETGASSSSVCPEDQGECKDPHTLTDVQQVPRLVFGLDSFTQRLQQHIISSRSDAECRYVGVWGMGGAGKTLLAQMAYNSQEVRRHFEGAKLIWLTVSQNPNIKGLYDSFCRQLLGVDPIKLVRLEECKNRLYNECLSRRVFLVLDDVWEEGHLEQLDLAKGPGSVTLVTTRKEPVLMKAGVIDEHQVRLSTLLWEDSWKLFCVHAFAGGLSNDPSNELLEVAKSVADECKGLPLALKVIGGSMIGKTRREEWKFQLKRLQDSCVLAPEKEEEELFGRLKLSYDNLDNDDPRSKECFLDFAAFPEDRLLSVGELIGFWKRAGLLPARVGDDPVQGFGDDPTQYAYYLLGLLIGRSLIEVHGADGEYSCKVHDVMRDLALHIIQYQRPHVSRLYRPGKGVVEFPREWRTDMGPACEARKLSLMKNDLSTLNDVTFLAPKLEMLLLNGNSHLKVVPKGFLKGVQNLKVLDLAYCRELKSLPKEVGSLKQLTHLNLRACDEMKYLPNEIGNLRQLIHLDLRACDEMKSLPNEIGNLRQLIHLDLSACGKLKYLPNKIGNLRQLIHLDLGDCWQLVKVPKSIGYLQSLQWFSVQYCFDLKNLPFRLCGLTSLQHLYLGRSNIDLSWGKRISGTRRWKLHDRASLEDIWELATLTELSITGWGCDEIFELPHQLSMLVRLKTFCISDFTNLKTFPKCVQPMVHLEKFEISGSVLITSVPPWITSFSQLKELELQFLWSLESLPALNTLQLLSSLSIAGCTSIKKLPDSFTSSHAFPNLQKLVCIGTGLVELPEVENGAMPKLQELSLGHCKNFKRLPLTLISLKNLKVVEIYGCTDEFQNLCKEDFQDSWLWGSFWGNFQG